MDENLEMVLPVCFKHRPKETKMLLRTLRQKTTYGRVLYNTCPIIAFFRFVLPRTRRTTLAAIGKRINLCPERIRQLEARTIRMLKHPTRSKRINGIISDIMQTREGQRA